MSGIIADLTLSIIHIATVLLILDMLGLYYKVMKKPPEIAYEFLCSLLSIYIPRKYLQSREEGEKYSRKIRKYGGTDHTKLEGVEKFKVIGESDGFDDRQIIKVSDMFTTVQKDRYSEKDFLFLDDGRVRGKYIPLVRNLPLLTSNVEVDRVLKADVSYSDTKVYTSNRVLSVDEQIKPLIQNDDVLVLVNENVVGLIEEKPKW